MLTTDGQCRYRECLELGTQTTLRGGFLRGRKFIGDSTDRVSTGRCASLVWVVTKIVYC